MSFKLKVENNEEKVEEKKPEEEQKPIEEEPKPATKTTNKPSTKPCDKKVSNTKEIHSYLIIAKLHFSVLKFNYLRKVKSIMKICH